MIVELMVKNGVTTKFSENLFKNLVNDEPIIELDFSEHDKVFMDKIARLEKKNKDLESRFTQREQDSTDMIMKLKQEKSDKNEKIAELACENESLKQRIAELESKETETVSDIDTSNPLACAESLIEHMTHCEKFMIMPERDVQTFSVEELKEIADYLMVYYKHHKDRDAEETILF